MRFVVVEIPDNQEALDFIAAIVKGDVYYGKYEVDEEDGTTSVKYTTLEGCKVPQAYGVPTLFCECETTHPEAKSKKLGWYVCTKCAKPRKGSMQHPFNLIEAGVSAQHRVYYMGFRADRRPWRIPKEGK